MAIRKQIRKTTNEAADTRFTFKVDVDTTGETLTGIAQAVDGSGDIVTLGTVTGTAANTEITIALSTSSLLPIEYIFEIWADYEGTSPLCIVPMAGDVFILDVQDRIGSDAQGSFDTSFDTSFF